MPIAPASGSQRVPARPTVMDAKSASGGRSTSNTCQGRSGAPTGLRRCSAGPVKRASPPGSTITSAAAGSMAMLMVSAPPVDRRNDQKHQTKARYPDGADDRFHRLSSSWKGRVAGTLRCQRSTSRPRRASRCSLWAGSGSACLTGRVREGRGRPSPIQRPGPGPGPDADILLSKRQQTAANQRQRMHFIEPPP